MTLRAFQCFAAGERTDMSGRRIAFSNNDLQQIAVSYHLGKKPAPLVLGHPSEADTISQGSVRGLVAHEDALFAVADVGPGLLNLVRTHRYKHVSASFFMPGGAGNPLNDGYYLRHVGFLGAVPPAVKGMQPLAFATDDTADFADACYGNTDSYSARLYRVALDIQSVRPDIALIDAATRAERSLTRYR